VLYLANIGGHQSGIIFIYVPGQNNNKKKIMSTFLTCMVKRGFGYLRTSKSNRRYVKKVSCVYRDERALRVSKLYCVILKKVESIVQ
jgi:hypothetical protein